MAEETDKGDWRWRTTIDGRGNSSGWEKYWDPDATPLSEAEIEYRRRRIMEILFAPRPDAPE